MFNRRRCEIRISLHMVCQSLVQCEAVQLKWAEGSQCESMGVWGIFKVITKVLVRKIQMWFAQSL